MAFSFEKTYANLLIGSLTGRNDWLSRLNNAAEIPDGATEGSIGISYIASVTAADIADGTMVTNGTTTTTVNGTYVDKGVTSAWLPSEVGMLRKPGTLQTLSVKQADALIAAQQASIIADLKAGTALSGASLTLTTGQIDFVTDGGTDEILDNLKNMIKCISLLMASFTNTPSSEMAIVMPTTAYANFTSLVANGVPSPQYLAAEKMWYFMGIPVFPINGTNFGGANYECAFVTTKESALLARRMPYLSHGGPWIADDLTTKLSVVGPYAHAAIDGMWAEIVNPAS